MSGGAPRTERKVVTVVFCDLVGFTAKAESMDPEDIAALLGPYHQRVRGELERHGGTVEKFIGDAVMALFGAPIAHEDDPERAVRAALAIREFALAEDLELRVGVTTAEALVRLDAQPDAGEGMASGDVVNTAARLQSSAPVNGILVDETTYRATRSAVDYDEAEPVEAKGKANPIAVWTATAAHSRFGVDVAHEARSQLVGRERELGIVRDAFERARHERTPQLLTLVGVPGIGKSRLVYELQQVVDADPELITWRQGRCLAYGDGITLWALGEIVKAQAGVLEGDTAEEITEKIRQTVEGVLAGTGDESRTESHLLTLLGLAGEPQLGGDRRNEAFAAWRRFLEALAEQRPLVLVVEDIHWADEILLDFLDELVDWMTDVPLLVVATARPELLERRPNWGGGKLNATTLALSPLSDEQTAELMGRLLDRPLIAAESQQALLERAGGNPLYAEQFVELYRERGSANELPLPETLQGIIAARLDGLPVADKDVLQDAAVVGKVFWSTALGGDAGEVTASLHSLERKGFVRRQRRSSLEGESEFAFAHALVRDVSYGQIPRAERAVRHGAVAEWLDGLGRPEDHAEMLAYHWSSALELVRASGGDDSSIVEPTRLALRAAGDRARSLNGFTAAAALYEDALALWPPDDAEGRAELLFAYAVALFRAYDEERRVQALEEARDALMATGRTDIAGEAEVLLSNVAFDRGADPVPHVVRALELAGDVTSPAAARVQTTAARMSVIRAENDAALALGAKVLAMAEELGLDEIRAHALTTIGMAKSAKQPRSGTPDIERARDLALEADLPVAAAIVNNLAADAASNADVTRAAELYEEAYELAERFGDRSNMRFIRGNIIWFSVMRGNWRVLADAESFIAECEAGAPHTQEPVVRLARAYIRAARGDLGRANEDFRLAIDLAGGRTQAGFAIGPLALWMSVLVDNDRTEDARPHVDALVSAVEDYGAHGLLLRFAPVADRLGATERLRVAIARPPSRTGPWRELVETALSGRFLEAADGASNAGALMSEAMLRQRAGELLVAQGSVTEGTAELRRALAFHRSVEASLYIEQVERILGEAQSASA
jgi:predicted ATPase/class 3 adenylate cyclase